MHSSSPLPSPRLPVPLLCIALASSPSGWGASASSGAARASDADGGPSLVLQKHPYAHVRALRPVLELSVDPTICPWYLSGVGVRRSLAGQDWSVRLGHSVFAVGTQKGVGMLGRKRKSVAALFSPGNILWRFQKEH